MPHQLNFRTWSQILPQSGSTGEGVPGEGDRLDLVRFDSPEFGSFVASAAWGEDEFWDVALRYAGEHSGFKFAGGIGYSDWTGTGSLNDLGCAIAINAPVSPAGAPATPAQFNSGAADCSTLGLSASIQHVETGLYGCLRHQVGRKCFVCSVTQVINAGGTGGNVDEEDSFYSASKRKFGDMGKLGKTTVYGE